ncbi:MAG: FAD-dependent oxidoreductase, partial [Thermoanaerobaculales bacterium]
MNVTQRIVTVVGGGLAGCEAAWQIATAGVPVRIVEMRPLTFTPAPSESSVSTSIRLPGQARATACASAVPGRPATATWTTRFFSSIRRAARNFFRSERESCARISAA